jgi:hypothetical protein
MKDCFEGHYHMVMTHVEALKHEGATNTTFAFFTWFGMNFGNHKIFQS